MVESKHFDKLYIVCLFEKLYWNSPLTFTIYRYVKYRWRRFLCKFWQIWWIDRRRCNSYFDICAYRFSCHEEKEKSRRRQKQRYKTYINMGHLTYHTQKLGGLMIIPLCDSDLSIILENIDEHSLSKNKLRLCFLFHAWNQNSIILHTKNNARLKRFQNKQKPCQQIFSGFRILMYWNEIIHVQCISCTRLHVCYKISWLGIF